LTQQQTEKKRIFVVNSELIQYEDLVKGAESKIKVRYLIDERHGSDRFALRLYTLEKGGHTPLDKHEYEHQVYILKGQGVLREVREGVPGLRALRQGDAIFIPSDAVHQFINEHEEPLLFLCVKGNPALYKSGSHYEVGTDQGPACAC